MVRLFDCRFSDTLAVVLKPVRSCETATHCPTQAAAAQERTWGRAYRGEVLAEDVQPLRNDTCRDLYKCGNHEPRFDHTVLNLFASRA